MSIIDRAIERINVPDMIIVAMRDSAFFSDDMTAGPMLVDLRQQKIFGGAIHFSHKINRAFIIDLMFAVITGAQDGSSLTRQILYLAESGRFHVEELFFSRKSLMKSSSG